MPSEEEIRRLGGLGEAEAAERLRLDGPNELPSTKARGILALALDILREPMLLLLVACGAVYLVLGDRQEALVLLASVFVMIGINLYQTQRTERALEALRDLSSPRALVIRDGRERRIAGREVARGDLVVLAEGDRVPADAVVRWSMNLTVDESLLTGESVPVRKESADDDAPPTRPGGEGTPFVYSGTLVVGGQGIARVRATGLETELGRIGRSLETTDQTATRLEDQVVVLVRIVGIAGFVLCGLITVLYGLLRASWLQGVLAGLALAMSLMPEEFPVILTLFLALGAWRISRRNVLVRRMPALEALGATTVLCVDKTGTLTQNRMAVEVLAVDDDRWWPSAHAGEALPEEFHRLLEFALLASQENPFDPMEQAINALGRAALAGTEHLHRNWTLAREYPLSRELLAMSHAWKATRRDGWVVAAKGAPETIADLCHLDAPATEALAARVATLADQGFRVLAVAASTAAGPTLPDGQHDFPFALLGLLGLADPIRPAVPAAVAECTAAGIRTVMITGDYPGTARHVAAEIGLAHGDRVLTGPEIDAMDDAALTARVADVGIFARVVPEQKLRLVRAFEATGAVTAMTGDGVNDAPALKAADIGVAMGGRGTDVAREAADLVLVDDDFASIAHAVRLGRRVYDNIRKGMSYVVSIHVPIAGISILPVLFGLPLVLMPVHIVFLELIIDPACSIAFEAEPEESDVMTRPPRDPEEPLMRGRTFAAAVLRGLLALAVVCGVFAIGIQGGYDEARCRTLAFSTLILMNLSLILASRSAAEGELAALRMPNRALWGVIVGALVVLAASLTAAPMRTILRMAPPSPFDLAVVLGAGVVGLAGLELVTRVVRDPSHRR